MLVGMSIKGGETDHARKGNHKERAFQRAQGGELPGGLVARASRSHSERAWILILNSGNSIPHAATEPSTRQMRKF